METDLRGFSVLAPMTVKSRRRKWVNDAGNLSQRMQPAMITKPLFDAIVVEDSQSSGRLANTADTN